MMNQFEIALFLATFCCTTVFGFVLLFAIVIMPGIGTLDNNANYLTAFQAMDGIIQNNQPIFITLWVGSLGSTLWLLVVSSCWKPTTFDETSPRFLSPRKRTGILWIATALVVVGHVITVAGNIPLNNRLHGLEIDNLDESTLATERSNFEQPWNLYNNVRTVLFGVASLFLLTLVLVHGQREDGGVKQNVALVPMHVNEHSPVKNETTNYQTMIV